MFERIRILPVTIAILIIFMGIRTLDVWSGVETTIGAVSPARASEDKGSSADEDHGEGADDHAEASDEISGDSQVLSTSGYLSATDVDLINSLEKRNAEFDAWESELKMRERMLEVAEGKVETKIAELKALEVTLRSLVEVQSEKEEADLTRLVKVYETMKPQDSAPIIQRLDEDTQLAIAARMKETKLAAIFAKMEDDTPQKLTVRLMERSELSDDMQPVERSDLTDDMPPAE